MTPAGSSFHRDIKVIHDLFDVHNADHVTGEQFNHLMHVVATLTDTADVLRQRVEQLEQRVEELEAAPARQRRIARRGIE